MEITLHTGTSGSEDMIHVDWFDENGVHKNTDVLIRILPQDRPRVLCVDVDGSKVFQSCGKRMVLMNEWDEFMFALFAVLSHSSYRYEVRCEAEGKRHYRRGELRVQMDAVMKFLTDQGVELKLRE